MMNKYLTALKSYLPTQAFTGLTLINVFCLVSSLFQPFGVIQLANLVSTLLLIIITERTVSDFSKDK